MGGRRSGRRLVNKAIRLSFRSIGESLSRWQSGDPPPKVNTKKLSDEEKRSLLTKLAVDFHGDRASEVPEKVAALPSEKLDRSLAYYLKQRPWTPNRENKEKARRIKYDVYECLEQNPPYESLFELLHGLSRIDERLGEAFAKIMPQVSDEEFGKFDFVVFSETNNIFQRYDEKGREVETQEVLIYNPKLQRAVRPT